MASDGAAAEPLGIPTSHMNSLFLSPASFWGKIHKEVTGKGRWRGNGGSGGEKCSGTSRGFPKGAQNQLHDTLLTLKPNDDHAMGALTL